MSYGRRNDQRKSGRATIKARKRRRMQPTLLALEDRRLLSNIVVTNTASSGTGWLAWAVGQANLNGGAETITFDKTAFKTAQTINLNGSALELTDTTGTETITGPTAGVTVNAGGNSRVFLVDGTASISGLTITGGVANASSPYIASAGGGREFRHPDPYGRCPVQQRSPRRPERSPLGIDGLGAGGGVGNLGTLTVRGCTFTDNQAVGGSGSSGSVHAGSGAGGGIANLAVANVTNSTFTGNLAQGGSNSSGNDAGGPGGGGIVNFVSASPSPAAPSPTTRPRAATTILGSSSPASPQAAQLTAWGLPRRPWWSARARSRTTRPRAAATIRAAPSLAAVSAADQCQPGVATISKTLFARNSALGRQGGSGGIGANGGGSGLNSFNLTGAGTVVSVSGSTFTNNSATGGPGGSGANGGEGLGGSLSSLLGAMISLSSTPLSLSVAQGGAAGAGGSSGNSLGGGEYV